MARIMPTSAFTNTKLGVQSQASKNPHSSLIEPQREREVERERERRQTVIMTTKSEMVAEKIVMSLNILNVDFF